MTEGHNESPANKWSSWWSYPIPEVFATFVAGFSFLCIGLLRAYTSPAIASMKDEPGLLNSTSLTQQEVISWVASGPPLAAFFGTILSGPLLQYLGRKGTLTALTWPLVCGWLMISFAGTSIALILIGRFLTGFAAGLATASAQLYISECVRAEVRGTLGFLPAMMLALGVLIGFTLSTLNLDWRKLALVMSTFPTALLAMVMSIPESPSWFIMKGKDKCAILSLKKLRGNLRKGSEVEKELLEIKGVISTPEQKRMSLFQLVGDRSIWYPGCIAVILMFFQQFTGANAVIYYLSIILMDAKPKGFKQLFSSSNISNGNLNEIQYGLDTTTSSVVVGVVQFLAFFVSLPLIDRVGRRKLLMCSGLAMSIPHGILGLYYFCNQPQSFAIPAEAACATFVESTGIWLPLTCLSSFIAAYSLGFGPICFILMSELFPRQARSYLCSVTSFVNHVSLFLVVWGFPLAQDKVGLHWTFWIFLGCCMVSVWFVMGMVPETKGKTLLEIEHIFRKSETETTSTAIETITKL